MIVVTACFRAETKAIQSRSGLRLVYTAMGSRAADDLERLDVGRPALLVSAGFCGAVAADLRVGDLIIADEIRLRGEIVLVDRALAARAMKTLNDAGLASRVGPVECSATVAGRAEKQQMAARGAVAVDMEGGFIARWAEVRSVPFLSYRVVLDAADEDVCFSDRAPFWLSALRHPRCAARLVRASGLASRRLGAGIHALADAWGGEG